MNCSTAATTMSKVRVTTRRLKMTSAEGGEDDPDDPMEDGTSVEKMRSLICQLYPPHSSRQ
jgi:hypothetical protein